MTKPFCIAFILCGLRMVCAGQDALKSIDSLLYDAQFDHAIIQVENKLKLTSDENQRALLENKKAEALIRSGRFSEAENILKQISLHAYPANIRAITEGNRGFLYMNQGRNDLALTTFEVALRNIETDSQQNTLAGAQILSYLGNLYLATGKYAQAEAQLIMALNIREGLLKDDNELIAASYNDLGLVYSVTDANKALDYYEKALSIYEKIHGKDHPKIAIANTNIGLVYGSLEFFGDAVNNFESALAIWDKIYPEAHPTKAFVLFNLGQTYLKMRQEKSAEIYYERALAMYQQSYGEKHPGIATTLNAMGNLKLSSHHFDEALNDFQKALISNVGDFNATDVNLNPAAKNYYSGNTLLYALLNKAEALEARHFGKSLKFKEFTLALKTLQICDTLIDNLRQQITNESDKISLGAIATEVYAAGVRIAYEAGQVSPNKKHWNSLAFYFAEKSKSAVLLEAISESNAKSFSGIPNDMLDEEKKLKSEMAVTAQKLSMKPTESEEKYLRELLFTLNRNYENFIRQLEIKFPSYYNLKFNVTSPSIKNLREKLDDHTALLSYFTDEKNNRLYIFQITSKTLSIVSRKIPDDFERNITGLRNSLTFDDKETFKVAAEKLSYLLLPQHIPAPISELVIIPTGRLSIIPFETLFTEKIKDENTFTSFPYLLKRYSVRYEFSAALILQKTELPTSLSPSIYLCAPVTFEKEALAELPGTESEVNEISKLFLANHLKSAVFSRQMADEYKVKDGSLKNFSYLHFATHGIVDETDPEQSRIFLRTSSDREDGNLYANEIYNLELNADLVTLSACQTGLGKISKGEGVIGLSRALVYAGSKNVMVSFWSVADESTENLMKDFYRQLLNTRAPAFSKALRQAKLSLVSGDRYSSPYYWAPFILIGF